MHKHIEALEAKVKELRREVDSLDVQLSALRSFVIREAEEMDIFRAAYPNQVGDE